MDPVPFQGPEPAPAPCRCPHCTPPPPRESSGAALECDGCGRLTAAFILGTVTVFSATLLALLGSAILGCDFDRAGTDAALGCTALMVLPLAASLADWQKHRWAAWLLAAALLAQVMLSSLLGAALYSNVGVDALAAPVGFLVIAAGLLGPLALLAGVVWVAYEICGADAEVRDSVPRAAAPDAAAGVPRPREPNVVAVHPCGDIAVCAKV